MPRKGNSPNLRKGRVSQSGQIYLITMVCWRRLPYFKDLIAGRCFVQALISVQGFAETLCYVVMPDHVHWLMQLTADGELSVSVQKVKSLTTKAIKSKGAFPVWQKGYHDHALRAEEDIVDVARYVVANPLRAGLVKSIRDYSLWDACWL
ncbi:MAG: transposase [Porticoccaceae bacterium]|nr:transposase [Porticoccaceae bacterium]